jgi:uncharacterized membrane protein
METFFILLWIGTSLWVLIDAKTIGVKKGQIKGMGNMGPAGWFVVCLLLWIIGFPFYLAKRGEYKRINSKSSQVQEKQSFSHGSDPITQIEKLAQLKEKGIITEEEFAQKKKELLK